MTTINAFDALSTVSIAATVRATAGGAGQPFETVLQCVTAIDGVGEDDPREWLRDALVGLLEAL